jgi:hypothetical protein
MDIQQTNRFKKAYKKLHPRALTEANSAIERIIADPAIGEQKAGDLAWLRVYKFSMQNQLTLIGYSAEPESGAEGRLTLVDLGSHENFYRDIK